jgi:hypothetical protein
VTAELDRPLTFAEAEKANAYELAQRWLDHDHFPVRITEAHGFRLRTVESELEELATMSALRSWLERWTPLQIHLALLAGGSIDQVAAAVGVTADEAAATWRAWDAGQRQLWQTFPDMARAAEHDQVADILAAVDR